MSLSHSDSTERGHIQLTAQVTFSNSTVPISNKKVVLGAGLTPQRQTTISVLTKHIYSKKVSSALIQLLFQPIKSAL